MSDPNFKLDEIQRALGRVEAQLETLVGNGQPGKIKEMEDDIKSLQNSRANAAGWLGGATAVIVAGEGVFHWLLHRAGLK